MNRLCLAALGAVLIIPARLCAQRPDTLRLSLQDAVSLALRNSDEVRMSAALVDVADAQVGTARASGLPQLRVNSTYSHVWENARANAVGSIFNQPNTYNASLSLSQTFFQGGRIVASTRAASDTRAASRLDEQEARSRLTVDVQRAYLQVLFTTQMVAIQRSNVALASSRVDQIEQMQNAGRAARYDVLRARVERANLEPVAIQSENDRDIAMLDLKRVLNIPINVPIVPTTSIDPNALRTTLVALEDSTTLPDRPSLRSAELIAAGRHQGVIVARADLLPFASVTIQNGFQAFPPLGGVLANGQPVTAQRLGIPIARGFADNAFCAQGTRLDQKCQNGGWFTDRSVTATISFPLFDGLRAKSNIDLARAQERVAQINLQLTRETVSLEVARARAELKRARAVFEARQENSGQAREAFQLASLRFNRGLSTQLEVSDAQLALLTAQTTEARGTYDLYLATAELARALGRPIPFPPTLPSSRSSDSGTSREP